MGNSIPITSPPRPSPSRAVIFLEPQGVRSYLRETWRKPAGQLQIVGPTDELPAALDGVVPYEVYEEMVKSVADRAANYAGGRIHIAMGMFQACLFLVVILGFFSSRYLEHFNFFNPITLGVLGTLELGVLSQAGRIQQREEKELCRQLHQLVHPWRDEYGIIAKIRRTRGQIGEDREGKSSSTYYCLVLEKIGPEHDLGTASISDFTEMESDVESQV